ncbi:hypothetical protein [Paracoccus aerodenitrificans]|nr:hypothetical protein [Paracoccus aerodenitrificans]WBU64120.1 hypothetical protein PAE61_01300 [Paracoccus aerodenitrificans]
MAADLFPGRLPKPSQDKKSIFISAVPEILLRMIFAIAAKLFRD